MTRTRRTLLLVVVYAAAFRLVTLNRPFYYDDEATGGSFYGLLARNYLRFPWAETHGVPVVTMGSLPGIPVAFYPDHPPLVPLLIVPVYRMFGVGEWQTRLPTSIATVLTVCALYCLMKRFGTERAAVIAAALFAATPMALYFGGQPEVLGMPLVLFTVLTVCAYLDFHHETTRSAFALLLALFTLAALSDWPAFVLVPVLVVHFAATRRCRDWGWIVGFGVYASVLLVALSTWIAFGAHLPWNWMVPLVQGRAAIGVAPPFSAREWLQIAWTFNARHHTVPLLVAAFVWTAARGFPFQRDRPGATAVRLVLAWGVLHVVIARQGVYNHEWWWWPLTPGIAAASALLVDELLTIVGRRTPSRLPQVAVAVAVGVFATSTAVRTYAVLYAPRPAEPFTTVELGRAIRAAAPGPDDLAMLAWSGDDPEVFFYGDRPLRAGIWSVADFLARRADGSADLVFSDIQPWPAPAAGLVFPAIGRRTLPELHGYLSARYPRVPLDSDLSDKFDVFDLRAKLLDPRE